MYDEEIELPVVLIGVCQRVQSDFACRRSVLTIFSSFLFAIMTLFERRMCTPSF
ncbi:uncharacterized protein ARMOST_21653 [Armillaria ostoyae]|uniref:Uncharacterized protein n=1 Tax=Armillaria ostoyae TaxID=47428 RepID=A0A284SAP3_ARMOS|nr:uncharacterized protein ARMOST_21653 [Armillaria ostoyae]